MADYRSIYLFFTLIHTPSWCLNNDLKPLTNTVKTSTGFKHSTAFNWDMQTKTEQIRYETVCKELAQFVPHLCYNKQANLKCKKFCGHGKILPILSCGRRLPPDPAKKMKNNKEEKRAKRLVGGKLSEQGEWPWQVTLRGIKRVEQTLYGTVIRHEVCAGAILSKHFILTAAHCFDGKLNNESLWGVFAGNFHSSEKVKTKQLHKVKKIITHEKHGNKLENSDIAVLQLHKPINVIHENKGRICLPDSNNPIPDFFECFVVGWGKTSEHGFPSSVLKHARVLTVPRDVCNLPMNHNNKLDVTQLCAGHRFGETDICSGDSGGSMVCRRNSLWYTAGVISRGYACGGRPQRYGVYANVTFFKDWITETILEKSDPFN